MKIVYIADKDLMDKVKRLKEELRDSETDYVILETENDYLKAVLSLLAVQYDSIQMYHSRYRHLFKTLWGILSKSGVEMDEHRASTVEGLLRKILFYDGQLANAIGGMENTVRDMRMNIDLSDDDEEDDDLL